MGRKLPWANTTNIASAKYERPKQTKPKPEPRVKNEIADDSGGFLLSTPDKSQPDLKRKRNTRASSRSPPPMPPSVDFMREGITGDDIYMLVEDDFQAVAQSFTAHLHMAEYQRLKAQTRARQTNEASIMVPSGASVEVHQKHIRANLEEIQNNVLDAVTDRREDDGEPVIEPWAGTSLAELMRWDGSQKTSLKGLDGLSSASRAAKGYRPNSERGTQSQGGATVIKGDDKKAVDRAERVVPLDAESGKGTELKRREDEAATRSSTRKEEGRERIRKENADVGKAQSKPDTQAVHNTNSAKPRARPEKKARSFLDDLDDFDEAGFASTSQAKEEHEVEEKSVRFEKTRSRPPTKARVKHEDKSQTLKKKDRSSRYDEIPVFLF